EEIRNLQNADDVVDSTGVDRHAGMAVALKALESLANGRMLLDRFDLNERNQDVLGFGSLEVEDPSNHPFFADAQLALALPVRKNGQKLVPSRDRLSGEYFFDGSQKTRKGGAVNGKRLRDRKEN